MTNVVLDTNIFVADSFNNNSSSAKVIKKISEGKLKLIWDEETKAETKHILNKIPPVNWDNYKNYFLEHNKFDGKTISNDLEDIEDPDDRKFLAVARASDAVLITNDSHLLDKRNNYNTKILTPSEFINKSDL